jgi:hypothetical protein
VNGREPSVLLVLKAEQMTKPSVFLTNVYRDERVPVPLRIAAAAAAAPYVEPRCTDRRISSPIDLPIALDVATARGNIALIKTHVAIGRLGIEEGSALIELEMRTIDACMATAIEMDLKIVERHVEEHPTPSTVHVKGGLPALPLGERDSPILVPENPPEPSNPWNRK